MVLEHICFRIFFHIINGPWPYGSGAYVPGPYGSEPQVEAKISKKPVDLLFVIPILQITLGDSVILIH